MATFQKFRRPLKPSKNTDPRHISLYLGPATKEALRVVRAYPEAETGGIARAVRINTICERYAAFLDEYNPTFSEAEWCGLMAIFSRGFDSDFFGELRRLDHGVLDYVRAAHEAGEPSEWEYDRKSLEDTLAGWSGNILYMVAEIVDRFWATDLDDGRNPRQRLEDCGAKVGR